MTFVTYLTIYSGTLLPQFYIGSTSLERHRTGYYGSVKSKRYSKIWNSELKNNPHLFDSIVINEFETRTDALADELRIQKQLDVVRNPLFINQSFAAVNGSFGRNMSGEWNPFFNNPVWKGRKQTDDHIEKRIDKIRGEKNGMVLKGGHDDAAKEKISAAASGENNPMHRSKGRTPPALGRTGAKHPQFGKHWYYNPETGEQKTYFQDDVPEGFIRGRFIK